MLTILLGILSSVAAEVVTALNERLKNTVLKGDGAFLLAFGMAAVGAAIKEVMLPGFQISDLTNMTKLAADFSEIFAVSQVYFLLVMQKLNLDVQSPADVTIAVVPADQKIEVAGYVGPSKASGRVATNHPSAVEVNPNGSQATASGV